MPPVEGRLVGFFLLHSLVLFVGCVVEGNLMGEQGAIFASEKRAGIIKVLH